MGRSPASRPRKPESLGRLNETPSLADWDAYTMQPISEHEKRWAYLSQKHVDAMEQQAAQPATIVQPKVKKSRHQPAPQLVRPPMNNPRRDFVLGDSRRLQKTTRP